MSELNLKKEINKLEAEKIQLQNKKFNLLNELKIIDNCLDLNIHGIDLYKKMIEFKSNHIGVVLAQIKYRAMCREFFENKIE